MAYSDYSYRSSRKRPRDEYDDAPRHKRGRYSDPGSRGKEPEVSSEQRLESFITRLGEKSNKSLESNMESLADLVLKEMSEFKDKILRTICKCIYTLSEKISIYATLVGILNARKYEFGEALLDILMEELKTALILKEFEKARLLVRFLADLVNAKVVATSSIMSLFETFLTVTIEPDIPQVRSDWYVNMVLSALPWVGAELEGKKQSELDRLFVDLENYMSKRTMPYLPAFQVWTCDDPHPQNDALEVLWVQVKGMRAKDWKDHILLRPYQALVDSVIGGAYSHLLTPAISVPSHTDDQIYPLPTVVFRFFTNDDLAYADSAGSVLPSGESIDRYLLEDTISCILTSHKNNRKECANALMTLTERVRERNLMPMSYIIVEVVFGKMLQLPSSPQVLVYYSSLFIELCKMEPDSYPRILEQIIKLFFGHLDKMNMVCVMRLARWFAHHLSNYKFTFQWTGWSPVLRGRRDHPCICFLEEVFNRCIRLGVYEDFVELLPEEFASFVPPEPLTQFKYSSDAEALLPEAQVATKLIEAIRAKEDIQNMTEIIDSLSSVNPELSLDRNKFLAAKVSLVTQCVLYVGSKTISHSFMALTKFRKLLMDLTGTPAGKMACLEAVAEFFACNSQLHSLVVDKLVRMEIVDAVAVFNWLFSEKVTPHFTQQYPWDILNATILKTNTSHDTAIKELAKTNEDLKKVSDLDEVAMGTEERQGLERRVEELEEKVEGCVRMQKDMFLVICQQMISVLTEHLSTCDQEGVDYETTWFLATLDNFRQLLIQNYGQASKYFSSLESLAFTADVDSRILEVFQQFQALL